MVVSGLPNITPIFIRNWLMKMTQVLRAGDGARQLPQRLAHQARLQADVGVAHVALDLGLRHQRRDRVDHDDVERAGADQGLGDLQRLLAGVRLRDQQLFQVDAEASGVDRIEGMLGVDDRRQPAHLLGLGDDVQRQRRLARRLRTVDLDDPAARDAADPERQIERDASGRDGIDLHRVDLTRLHLHDRALAELALDLSDGHVHRAFPFRHGFHPHLSAGSASPGVCQSLIGSRFDIENLFYFLRE